MNTDQQAIDRVTYMASLASKADDVDPMLDTLRGITSKQAEGEPLALQASERQALVKLEADLSDYLTTRDPLRSFTKESLKATVDKHFKFADPAFRARLHVIGQILVIFMLAVVAYAVGMFVGPSVIGPRYTAALTSALFLSTFSGGIGWLLWSARKNLAPTVQRAYGVLSLGLIFSALVSAQYTVWAVNPELTTIPMFSYLGLVFPYVIVYITLYFGFYILTKQLPEIKPRITRPSIAGILALVIILVTVFVPHPTPVNNEFWYDVSLASFGLDVLFCAFGAALGIQVARAITKRYAKAIGTLSAAIIVNGIIGAGLGVLLFMFGEVGPNDSRATVISALFALSLLLQIAAGYLFKRAVQD